MRNGEIKKDSKPAGRGLRGGFVHRENRSVRIIPLGGLKEIGKNITAIETGNDIMLIDCGLCFPDDDMLGVDIVLPDFSYIVENQKKLKGLVVTHGHEDHIGAIPYILKQVNIPVYGTKLPLGPL